MKGLLSNFVPYLPQQIVPLFNAQSNVEISSSLIVELIESLFWQSVHFIFAPRTVLRQLWICASLQASVTTVLYFRSTFLRLYGKIFRNSFRGKLERLQVELRRAPTYASWLASAERYDRLVGCDKWRLEAKSTLYDANAVMAKTREFESFLQRVGGDDINSNSSQHSSNSSLQSNTSQQHLNRHRLGTNEGNEGNGEGGGGGGMDQPTMIAPQRDPISTELFALMFQLRGGLGRTDYGLLHQGLFTRARLGTKLIIERYLSATCGSLRRIAAMPAAPPDAYGHHSAHGGLGLGGWGKTGVPPPDTIPLEVKLSFFNEMRHAYGRTALMLSGGGMLALYHVGVIKALFLAGLLPRVICGASGGAIVASTFATKTNDELVAMGYFEGFAHSLQFYKLNPRMDGIYLCTDTLRDAIQANVGDWTFQEAFDRTGRILNVIVATSNSTEPPILLNYLTAPHVLIWSAALASSCSPGFFEPVPLLVREPDGGVVAMSKGSGIGPQLYEDGSMDSKLPMAQLSELFNVNHFIVSQASPHAGLLSSLSSSLSPALTHPLVGLAASAVTFFKSSNESMAQYLVTLVTDAGSLPRSTLTRGPLQILLEDYEGRADVDVTLFPWKGQISQYSAFVSAMDNPTPEEYRVIISASERNTWGQLPQIRAHVAVEVCLEQCVQHLRKALISRDSQGSNQDLSSSFDGPSPSPSPSSQRGAHGGNGSFDLQNTLQTKKKGMSRVPSFFTSKSQDNLFASVAQQQRNDASTPTSSSRQTTQQQSPNDYTMPLNDVSSSSSDVINAPGIHDGETNNVDETSLKCGAPLFSGHAIVDSPIKGWSWYSNTGNSPSSENLQQRK
eukprot:CAMPEP_0114339706 /NCGR_PEP_ID=MMETSP0101-20121206/7901_1 /TAXON_ID=38822 ORGANISM="Pteridomonas danica, Strain PT" /NCGR_SAMPLE_ID=MMETSP0101 /ASSEMBLY_ACC=CAM_ASM_000211 /LENGTH=843 /DNA_ID=CAMNT_0001472749 /DNA_START=41 /DNA_END=2573 /DNA_ORIENTATION=-